MTTTLDKLFETYGDSLMREDHIQRDRQVMGALEAMGLDRSAQVEVCDLLLTYYDRWSKAAFAIGLHLGMSLLDGSRA